ncbi:MAG: glycosyltransferase family 4 protein [Verrucomicrobia bacterium]|nr:glycosyltransferase family 4 protein [Verrucomicrobiota bacterium]
MRLGYAYSRYPVLSQTFCDAEMLELERRGHKIVLGSLYPPKTELRHEYLAKLRAPIHYAPSSRDLDKLARKAKRRGRWPAKLVAEHEERFGAEYKASLRARNALFFVELFERERVPYFHVHFANRAAHTALFVKEISGIPFSVTAHGQDFMSDLSNDELLREICAAAEFVGAETDFSRDLLARRCPASAHKILRIYNGLDLSRFPKLDLVRKPASIRLLSVGRLVPFKGFETLINACAVLRDLDVHCELIGAGPLREQLQARVDAENLRERVHFAGERSQKYVLSTMRDCDIFVLGAQLDERGASDVFPTVIAEAMACGKPVVSTTVAGIPELVVNGETGFLVHPGDVSALADAIRHLASDEDGRLRFGRAGRLRIEQNFTIEKTIEPLLEQFQKVLSY